MSARYYVGDALTVLRTLPDASVDLVMSSPPFLALRSYLPADHADKAHEIGSEATPGEFLDVLLDVVVECRRVLAPHGSLVFELGDTYAGSGGAGGDYNADGWREGQPRTPGTSKFARVRKPGTQGEAHPYPVLPDSGPKKGKGWPLDKSKVLIPELFAVALSYGFNPLTGRTLEPWRVRNVVAWCRPNPPVGALGDKFRPATSFLTVACMGRDRYFDLDAVREPHKRTEEWREGQTASYRPTDNGYPKKRVNTLNPAGAPPLDYWVIPTAPYKGAHYATFPPDLCIRPVKAMCPERVCRSCGAPSRRIVEPSERYQRYLGTGWGDPEQRDRGNKRTDAGKARTAALKREGGGTNEAMRAENVTLGWSDCGCSTDGSHWRAGIVLDPFAGSGTTLMVATGHGRDAIGIDLDPRNLELARERLGMFLEVAA